MTRSTKVLIALAVSLCALASAPVAGATAASSGPRTWYVLVGGHSEGQAIQAEGYYPHVMTIDAGDTVVWTLNTDEIHSVTFAGTCGDISCVPQCFVDIGPCGPSSYDGVTAVVSSGRMVPPSYNWDNAFPRGGTTYSLTFTKPGANVYFDLSSSGMRGVVVVNPVGTPYPFSQEQYSEQAEEQLQADLGAVNDSPATTSSANPGGTRTYHVAVGSSSEQRAEVVLGSADEVKGTALLEGQGIGTSPTPSIAVTVSLSGLRPGSVHAVQILPGVCGAPAATTGLVFSQLFVPPTFTLNNVTAGPDGRADSTTVITASANFNGPGQLRIPSSGWFINVAAGATPDNDATSAVCGDIVFRGAAVMRYLPQTIHVHVGDTVVWANDTTNEVHGVTFLAGQPLPQIPDWYLSVPAACGPAYDGSSFCDSGTLYAPDAGRNHSLTLTFTKAGTFSYVDVGDSMLGMHGSVIVAPPQH